MEDKKNVDLVLDEHKKFGKDQTEKALWDLQVYMDAKQSIDSVATANQEWFKLRHWNVIAGETNEAKKVGIDVGSAWTINSLLNKHADIMDNFPKPNVLAREADDEMEAKILTEILPSLLEENDYEAVYRQSGWDFLIDGACIKGAFWDTTKHDGLGDVRITNVDVHNLAWKPGISDIQDSDKVYHVSLEDIDVARAKWPKIANKIGPHDSGIINKYINDDNIDTSNCVEVVNMYYKKPVIAPVYMDGIDKTGKPTRIKVHEIPKEVLHLAIFVGDELAWCSENEEGYENGFYEHGKFPFVIARMFPVKDTPWGFGFLDIMKHPQKDIDKLDQAIIKIAQMRARPRYWARKNANIDISQFADWNQEIVEVGTGELGDAVARIAVDDVPAGVVNHLNFKVDELKETSGNRDFSQGSTAAGVTSGAAIAALQESGSKISRDVNKELYRAERELYYMVIELIRQFYSEPRNFRVPDERTGDFRYVQYSNANLVEQDIMLPDGTTRHVRPVFDISVSAEKASPFSRAAQNELAKELYSMGLFAPENTLPAMACIDMMDFDGKDKLKNKLQENSMIMQQLQSAMQMIQQMSALDPNIAMMAVQQGLIAPEEAAQMDMVRDDAQAEQQQQSETPGDPRAKKGTLEQRINRVPSDSPAAAKTRARAANASNPS